MQELACRNGVPTAQTVVLRSNEDLARFLETAVFPVIAKAIDADRFRRFAGSTKVVLQTRRELMDLYAKASPCGDASFLIQELIPGDDWMFNGYFDQDSTCIFGLTGQKVRRFPVNTGITSLGVCTRNETVQRTTTGFMKAIGYHGILDIGYRYDRRDGKYKVLDVNPRIGCTFRLFTSADGIDVARALYLNLTAQTLPSLRAIEGRKWIVEDFDLISSLRLLKYGSLRPKAWLESLQGIDEAACFAWDDPLPVLMIALTDCCEMARWLRYRTRSRRAARDAQAAQSSVSAQ
jgi:predicted ATP-grasp superfamily ATP-dependent carboligase